MAVRDKINKALIGAGGLAQGLVGGETAQQIEARKREGKKKSCEASGGTWDGTKCIRPKKETTTNTKNTIDTTTKITTKGDPNKISEVVRNEQGGTAGFIDPRDNKLYGTAGAPNPRDFINRFNQNRQLPEGTISTAQAAAEKERQARLQQLLQKGEEGLLTPEELQEIQEAPINWQQALTAGLANAAPSVIGGGVGGALLGGVAGAGVGSTVTAPAGALLGAVGGAISGIWAGTQANIRAQQKGEIGKSTQIITNAKRNLMRMRMVAEQDPIGKGSEVIEAYFDEISKVQAAQRQVQVEVQGNLNSFMEDGTDILSKFEYFLEEGGEAYWYKLRIEEAVLRGTPATPEQIIQMYLLL